MQPTEIAGKHVVPLATSYMVTNNCGDKRGKTCNYQQLTTFPGLLLITFGENRLIVAFVIFSNQLLERAIVTL